MRATREAAEREVQAAEALGHAKCQKANSGLLMQSSLQHIGWWQLCEILAHSNRLRIQLQEFHLLRVGGRTENQTDWRLLAVQPFVLVEPSQIKFHLPEHLLP